MLPQEAICRKIIMSNPSTYTVTKSLKKTNILRKIKEDNLPPPSTKPSALQSKDTTNLAREATKA